MLYLFFFFLKRGFMLNKNFGSALLFLQFAEYE